MGRDGTETSIYTLELCVSLDRAVAALDILSSHQPYFLDQLTRNVLASCADFPPFPVLSYI